MDRPVFSEDENDDPEIAEAIRGKGISATATGRTAREPAARLAATMCPFAGVSRGAAVLLARYLAWAAFAATLTGYVR